MRRYLLALTAGAALALMSAALVFGTTFQLVLVATGDIQAAKWGSSSITWTMNPTNTIVYSGSGTLASASDLQTLLANAFGVWSGAQLQGTAADTLNFTYNGTVGSSADFNSGDCINTLGFITNLGTAIIAETRVSEIITGTPGKAVGTYTCAGASQTCPLEVCITDADVEFNTTFNFYTPAYANPPANAGLFDLRTVAIHEIGHMIGLDHTGLANAIMFPYGDSGNGGVKSALAVDDIMGVSESYTNSPVLASIGSVHGTVTLDGNAAFGAHVAAIDTTTGNIVTDTLTMTDGSYVMYMPAGSYNVVVVPLASDSTTGDTSITNYSGFTAGFTPKGGSPPTNPTNYTGQLY